MDEIFGKENFINEIIWTYTGGTDRGKGFQRKHDTLLLYVKSPDFIFNPIYEEFSESSIRRFNKIDEFGRRYKENKLADGRITRTYMKEEGKLAPDYWHYNILVQSHSESLKFATQKPEKLLERIILASSNEGDLVADFFCGSGTTLAVAERLNRKWIGCDLSKVAIQVTRSRLVDMDVKPFVIENIGNYQREMIYLQGGKIDEMQRIIMKLYGSHQHPTHRDLAIRITDEGIKALVYVGYPDRHVTAKKAVEIARLAESLDGRGYKKVIILAWDYEYNFDANFSERARNLQVEVEPRVIPSDIYEYLKTSKTENDLYEKVVFHQKPYLKISKPSARPYGNGKHEVTIGIERYVLSDLPLAKEKDIAELNKLIKDNFAISIDYWAVDWDFDGHTFRSRWQDFRGNGRNAKTVTTKSKFILEAGKEYEIAVRAVDVFGNDASATVKVNLGGE